MVHNYKDHTFQYNSCYLVRIVNMIITNLKPIKVTLQRVMSLLDVNAFESFVPNHDIHIYITIYKPRSDFGACTSRTEQSYWEDK